MTIRTSSLKPKPSEPVAGDIGPIESASTAVPPVPRAAPKASAKAAVPKPARPPAEVAAAQAAIEEALIEGDTFRRLGLVSAMAMEQGVDVAAVLLAMRTIVDDWGHLADPKVVDLP